MVSKSEINRSGQLLRNEKIGDSSYSGAEILHATRVVEEFRRAFSRPLNLVTSKLRNMVQEMPGDVRVGQRLKRMPQIINKLIRFPETNLVRIQDIAGCRATFQSIEQVEIFLDSFKIPLKDEIGPEEIIEWLRVTSKRIAFIELGIPVPKNFEEEYDLKKQAAQLWMEAQEK